MTIALLLSWSLTIALLVSHVSLVRYNRRLRSKLADPGDEWSLRITLLMSMMTDQQAYLKKILEILDGQLQKPPSS